MPYVFLSQAESKTAFHKQQHSQNACIFPGSSGHTDTYRHNRHQKDAHQKCFPQFRSDYIMPII